MRIDPAPPPVGFYQTLHAVDMRYLKPQAGARPWGAGREAAVHQGRRLRGGARGGAAPVPGEQAVREASLPGLTPPTPVCEDRALVLAEGPAAETLWVIRAGGAAACDAGAHPLVLRWERRSARGGSATGA